MPLYVAGLTVFSTRAILEAHKAECAETNARTREMFQEMKASQKETEVRLEKSLQEVAVRFAVEQSAHHADNQRRFDKLEDQVRQLTTKLAAIIAGVAILGWVVEHFHLLSSLGAHI